MCGIFNYASAGLIISLAWSSPTFSQDLEAGQVLAEKKCGRCHATGVADKSKLGSAPPFRVLPSRYPVENLAEALAEGIVTGHPSMPEYTFHPEEIGDLLSYIDWLGNQTKSK